MAEKVFINVCRVGKIIGKLTKAVLEVLMELFYSLMVTYYVAKWAITYAYSARGYKAYGGEHILILFSFLTSFGIVHIFFRMLKKGEL